MSTKTETIKKTGAQIMKEELQELDEMGFDILAFNDIFNPFSSKRANLMAEMTLCAIESGFVATRHQSSEGGFDIPRDAQADKWFIGKVSKANTIYNVSYFSVFELSSKYFENPEKLDFTGLDDTENTLVACFKAAKMGKPFTVKTKAALKKSLLSMTADDLAQTIGTATKIVHDYLNPKAEKAEPTKAGRTGKRTIASMKTETVIETKSEPVKAARRGKATTGKTETGKTEMTDSERLERLEKMFTVIMEQIQTK